MRYESETGESMKRLLWTLPEWVHVIILVVTSYRLVRSQRENEAARYSWVYWPKETRTMP